MRGKLLYTFVFSLVYNIVNESKFGGYDEQTRL